MTIELPPRRALPADVKDRMRPVFTETRTRRNHTPLAVAAGVTLLIVGGLVVTRPAADEADPGRERVVAPSSQDVARCRAAIDDQGWSSTEMVVFGLRKVLVGEDGRFCELTLSRAGVAPPGFQPTRLEAGSVTYRSSNVIAGVPPLGTRTVMARENVAGVPQRSSSGIATTDFFIVHTSATMLTNELVFDDQAVPVQRFTSGSEDRITDSFESGDHDPWAPVNVLARCVDNAFNNNSATVDELRGWEPLLAAGLDRRRGMLIAHRGHQESATCAVSEPHQNGLSLIRAAPADPDATLIVDSYRTESEVFLAARTTRSARTVEVSASGTTTVTAEVTDGQFLATLNFTGGQPFSLRNVHVVARNAANEVVFEGSIG
ncbi:hypothetical protein SK803_15015 [Lentzea sp. BCCO 10_0856]|uniref:Uncharacterized protein n=1 Tax=Lentzea miocenica TaxID=3095431 RepID=A0ABU4T051_9PSEU|nr:hypothetical protein [Lentzea sp. BCCO 10_0856]MDX8031535.1 hypothetical protein [Lentzea sp. BCCO 10_0856]